MKAVDMMAVLSRSIDQLMVARQSTSGDGAGLYRGMQSTVGLAAMPAVAETAFAEIRPKFHKGVFDLIRRNVCQAEFLQSRRIDQ